MKIIRPEIIRKTVLNLSSKLLEEGAPIEFSDKHKGLLIGTINGALKLSIQSRPSEYNEKPMSLDQSRRLVLGWLFWDASLPYAGEISSKDLLPVHWAGIKRWIFGQNGSEPRQAFRAEARWLLERALFDLAYTRVKMERGEVIPFQHCLDHWESETNAIEVQEGDVVESAFDIGGVVSFDAPEDRWPDMRDIRHRILSEAVSLTPVENLRIEIQTGHRQHLDNEENLVPASEYVSAKVFRTDVEF